MIAPYHLYPTSGSDTVVYMIVPMHVAGLDQLAKKFAVNLVEVIVSNWDDDLTPWPAAGVFPGDPDFKGLAAQTLDQLRTGIMPEVEDGINVRRRQFVGISLSGLFAVWAWMQGDDFDDIASISGSFWYDQFTEWLATQPVSKQGMAYLSLGNKEGATKVQRYKSVVARTAEVEKILRYDGADVVFEWTQGNHFAPMLPRIEMALNQLEAPRDQGAR